VITVTVLTIHICIKVYLQQRKASKWEMKHNVDLTKQVFWQSFWYVLAFYVTLPVSILAHYVEFKTMNYFWIFVVTAIFVPGQGFLTYLVYIQRSRGPKMARYYSGFCCPRKIDKVAFKEPKSPAWSRMANKGVSAATGTVEGKRETSSSSLHIVDSRFDDVPEGEGEGVDVVDNIQGRRNSNVVFDLSKTNPNGESLDIYELTQSADPKSQKSFSRSSAIMDFWKFNFDGRGDSYDDDDDDNESAESMQGFWYDGTTDDKDDLQETKKPVNDESVEPGSFSLEGVWYGRGGRGEGGGSDDNNRANPSDNSNNNNNNESAGSFSITGLWYNRFSGGKKGSSRTKNKPDSDNDESSSSRSIFGYWYNRFSDRKKGSSRNNNNRKPNTS